MWKSSCKEKRQQVYHIDENTYLKMEILKEDYVTIGTTMSSFIVLLKNVYDSRPMHNVTLLENTAIKYKNNKYRRIPNN